MTDADVLLHTGRAAPSEGAREPRITPAPTRLAGMLAGTRLLTPTGYQAGETLRRGDLVATLIGRGPFFVPIAWIGRRRVTLAVNARLDPNAPVRIRRDAIADGMPASDVLLAPDHAVYLEGALYLAGLLVNRSTILRENRNAQVEYWGVRLERHNVLVAENLPIESLLSGSASAYAEIDSPRLRVIDGTALPAEDPPVSAPLDFPARIKMSARWFRRRLFTSGLPVTGDFTVAPAVAAQPARTSPGRGLIDVQAEAKAVLASLAGIARQRDTRLEIAIQQGLTVRIDGDEFRDVVAALVTHSIHATTGGKVLLGAMRHAGRIQIAVMDEGNGDDQSLQLANLRAVSDLVARRGGSLEIDNRPGEGTTLLLRLPEAAADR